ncbi:putative ribonuclease H-like domain-containing protein, partial [Tanacetum coccineum]
MLLLASRRHLVLPPDIPYHLVLPPRMNSTSYMPPDIPYHLVLPPRMNSTSYLPSDILVPMISSATCHHLSGAMWPASRHWSHHRTTGQRQSTVANDGQHCQTTAGPPVNGVGPPLDHRSTLVDRQSTGGSWPGLDRVLGRAEAVNIACYVQNSVLVTKPHNKTPYKLFLGRKPALGFMKPFVCLVTILNTIDHLGKFDGKSDEGFFVGYSINSKAFRVFNSRTKIVEENLHVQFYKPRMETVPGKDYILLPLWIADPPFSQSSKISPGGGFKPSGDDGKKVDQNPREDSEVIDQEKKDNVNSTNTVNAASTNEVNAVGAKTSIELPDDPNMPELEDIVYSDDDEDVGAEADMNNLDAFIPVSPIPTTRVHKDHPVEQIIGDLTLAPQTRRMTKNLKEHDLFSSVQQRTNHKDFQNYLFACFLSQEEPKKVELPNGKRAIGTKWVFMNKNDERGIVIKNKARLVTQGYTQEEGIGNDEVFAPVTKIEAIRLFLAYTSFKDFVMYQMDVKSDFLYGKIEEEVYVCQPPGFEDPDFPDRVYKVEKALYGLHQALRACQDKYVTEILNKFGFTDVKTASTPMETQKPLLKDEDGKEVDVYLYRSMISSLMYLTSSRPDI